MVEQTVKNVMTGGKVDREILPVPPDLVGIPGVGHPQTRPNANQSRYLLTGVPGSGKSTLFFSNPKAIVVDLEQSADKVSDPSALPFTPPIDGVTPTQHVRNFLERLIKRGPKDYGMVVFDTYDELVELFQTELMDKNKLEDVGDYSGGHGKGYFVVRREIFGYLDRLRRRGFGWALIAHISEKEVDGKSRRSLAVSASYRDIAVRKTDHLLHMEHRIPNRVIEVKGKRITVSGGSGNPICVLAMRPGGESRRGSLDDVKVRLPFPDTIEVPEFGGWAAFEAEFEKAVDLRLQQQQQGRVAST